MNGNENTQITEKLLEMEVWQTVALELRKLSPEGQSRVIRSVATLLEIHLDSTSSRTPELQFQKTEEIPNEEKSRFSSFSNSEKRQMTPKEFLHDKRPSSEVERVACLAYYLTHYRDTPYFKTLDLSKLNTEAAQLKISNPTRAIDNAAKAGYLVPASKGQKQISAPGELYVQALPDKLAARAATEGYKRRKQRKQIPSTKSNSNINE